MRLTSRIVPYDPAWPGQFEAERRRLANLFDRELVAIHHIGSTAISGTSAKPEIDILVVINDIGKISDFHVGMETLGYRVRGDVMPDQHYFTRNVEGRRTHKVHVCGADHYSVAEYLQFRDYLRKHNDVRDAYQALKIELERRNTTGIAEYLSDKEPFIRDVLARASS